MRNSLSGKLYIKQLYVGPTIYNTKRKVDFFIINKDLFPQDLIIECKWQQSPGSVDEKYPFLLLNIEKTNVPTIVVLDGEGYKPAAKVWLAEQVQQNTTKNLWHVWSMVEFQKALNNGFLG